MSTQSPSDADLAKLYEQIRADIATLDDDTRESVLPFYAGFRAHRVARSKGGTAEMETYAEVLSTYAAARGAMDEFKSKSAAPVVIATTIAPTTDTQVAPTPTVSAPTSEPSEPPTVITDATDLAKLPDCREITIALNIVVAHPRNAVLLPASSTDEDDRLAADIEANGLVVPIVVAGAGCASPPGTLLDGHRRTGSMRSRGICEARAVVRTGLTAHDEEMWIVRSAIASQLHRKLTEEQKFRLEERARELLRTRGHRQGHRSDLGTSVAGNGSSGGTGEPIDVSGTWVAGNPSSPRKGEASAIVAKASTESVNAVKERQKIYGSPVTTEPLKQAVATQKISRKKAAAIVREVEGAEDTKLDDQGGVEAARSTIDERVREAIETLRGGARTRKPKTEVVVTQEATGTSSIGTGTGASTRKPTETHELRWSADGGAEVEMLGHTVQLTPIDGGIRIEVYEP
ncbi:MAG: hypothetical protein ACHREM_18415 [Polyangiales bacterium]